MYIFRWGTRNHSLFKDLGIPGPKPLPFIGNMYDSFKAVRLWIIYCKIVGIYYQSFLGMSLLVTAWNYVLSETAVSHKKNSLNKFKNNLLVT